MRKSFSGSCHCGAVRFKALLDLAPNGQRSTPERQGVWWTATFRCNCSYCSKTRYWKAFTPAEDFEWTAGRDQTSNYKFGAGQIDHYFCRTCGVQTFAHAAFEEMGGEFYCVNVACLDDVSDADLAAAPLIFEDGRADEWYRSPEQTGHM